MMKLMCVRLQKNRKFHNRYLFFSRFVCNSFFQRISHKMKFFPFNKTFNLLFHIRYERRFCSSLLYVHCECYIIYLFFLLDFSILVFFSRYVWSCICKMMYLLDEPQPELPFIRKNTRHIERERVRKRKIWRQNVGVIWMNCSPFCRQLDKNATVLSSVFTAKIGRMN